MTAILLSSSILSADFSRLGEQIREVEAAGIDWIHIDVMDGHFVPNITMGPFIVETCRRITQLPIDVHLMIEKPEHHIEAFANAGATTLSIHIEGNPNIYRTLQAIRSMGVKPAVAINPGTPANHIETVLDIVDMILVMTVNPGFSGQTFITQTIDKVTKIREMVLNRNLNTLIQVDGGITDKTLPQLYKAGANVFVTATAVFKYPDGITAGIQALHNTVVH